MVLLCQEQALKDAKIPVPEDFKGDKKSFTIPGPNEKCSSIGVLWEAYSKSKTL